MESASSIIRRLTAVDSPPMAVDAAGHPIPWATTSFRQQGQVSQSDAAGLTSQRDSANGGHSSSSLSSAADQMVSGLVSSVHSALTSTSAGHSGDGSTSSSEKPLPILTTNFGFPMADPTHSLNIGGHPVVSDTILFEKQQTFNRAKIVERAVHACGSGAFGYFEVTHDLSHLCKAAFLSTVGKKTPLFARFSTVTYGREFPDSARNPRGLAWKLYTEEGIYDILTVNFPSFFVRDPTMGPDNIRSQQRHPSSFRVDFDATFDFMGLVPESQLTNLWYWSDHGHPVGWRYMDSYPIHTFRWVNAKGEGVYVRYKIVSSQGIKNFSFPEAVKMCGEDPDFAKRDLWQHIEDGGAAEWIWYVQTMSDEQARTYYVDPFDATKRWNDKDCPPQQLGRLVVNRNPENYHRDVEQAAFSPGRLVPGIEPSPDALLQWRLVFYSDAQMYRLGVNYHQVPVNCPFRSLQYHPPNRDGQMRLDSNGGAEAHYFPNSFTNPPPPQPDFARSDWTARHIQGALSRHSHSRSSLNPDDEYIQAREFYLSDMTDTDREHLSYNTAVALSKVTKVDIVARYLICMHKVHPTLAAAIITAMQPLIATAKPTHAAALDKLTADRIQQLADSMPHASIPEQAYLPRPVQL